MNCFSLSSRATGPKIRVPLGSSWAFNKTAALSSKRIYDPSFLLTSFLVLTITALETVPFFTWLVGSADFTVTTILSPTEADPLRVPPSTCMQRTSFAPLLSATVGLDSVRIILFYLNLCYYIIPASLISARSAYNRQLLSQVHQHSNSLFCFLHHFD